MAAGTSPIFETTVKSPGVQFTSADTTTKKTLMTAGAAGARIDRIGVCSNDTAAVNLAFSYSVGGTDYYIGNVLVPIGSGYTTVAIVDAIATLSPYLGYLTLEASALLKVNCVATMTAAKTVDIAVVCGGDY